MLEYFDLHLGHNRSRSFFSCGVRQFKLTKFGALPRHVIDAQQVRMVAQASQAKCLLNLFN